VPKPQPKPLWGAVAIVILAILLPMSSSSAYVLGIGVLICIYGSINLMWALIIGTAGLPSFATMAVVGLAGYVAARVSLSFDAGWPIMLIVGAFVGAVAGLAIALPAIRLRGVYFMLLTLGLVQMCSSFISQSDMFGRQQGLYGTAGLLPSGVSGPDGARFGFYAAALLLLFVLSCYLVVDRGNLGRRLRVARENEPFAQSLGINMVRDRLLVFCISSAVMGGIGGFYAAFYHSISPSLLTFDLGLLLLAMVVVGGMESPFGIIAATALVVGVNAWFVEIGAMRLVLVGGVMLAVALVAQGGIGGIVTRLSEWASVGEDYGDSHGALEDGPKSLL
jgi:branched-chain amino acid transport system permease protein